MRMIYVRSDAWLFTIFRNISFGSGVCRRRGEWCWNPAELDSMYGLTGGLCLESFVDYVGILGCSRISWLSCIALCLLSGMCTYACAHACVHHQFICIYCQILWHNFLVAWAFCLAGVNSLAWDASSNLKRYREGCSRRGVHGLCMCVRACLRINRICMIVCLWIAAGLTAVRSADMSPIQWAWLPQALHFNPKSLFLSFLQDSSRLVWIIRSKLRTSVHLSLPSAGTKTLEWDHSSTPHPERPLAVSATIYFSCLEVDARPRTSRSLRSLTWASCFNVAFCMSSRHERGHYLSAITHSKLIRFLESIEMAKHDNQFRQDGKRRKALFTDNFTATDTGDAKFEFISELMHVRRKAAQNICQNPRRKASC